MFDKPLFFTFVFRLYVSARQTKVRKKRGMPECLFMNFVFQNDRSLRFVAVEAKLMFLCFLVPS